MITKDRWTVPVPAVAGPDEPVLVSRVLVQLGDRVEAGDRIAVVSAGTRESTVHSPTAGTVRWRIGASNVTFRPGARLFEIEPEPMVHLEGVVARGERFAVELRVDGEVASVGSAGEALTLEVEGRPVEVDATVLDLSAMKPEVLRGSWQELSAHPAAAAVASGAPAPHVTAELVVRRVGPGDRVELSGTPTDRGFEEEGAALREATERRVRAVRGQSARTLAERAPPQPQRAASGFRFRHLLVASVWLAASGIVLSSLLLVALRPSLHTALMSAGVALSSLAWARFHHRAMLSAPAVDRGMANRFVRYFARGARSLPRFEPDARDGARTMAMLGAPLVAGLALAAAADGLWAATFVLERSASEWMSDDVVTWSLAARALLFALLAAAYAMADGAERARTRALAGAVGAASPWRALVGRARGGPEDLLYRKVVLGWELDPTVTQATVSNQGGGAPELELDTEVGVVTVPTADLAWASDDWVGGARSARVRVVAGRPAVVAGFWDGETIRPRGPRSLMLYAVPEGDPARALRRKLRRRILDTLATSLVAAVLAALAGLAWLA